MPNIVPGAIWQPINVGKRAKRIKGRGLVGHVAVSSSKNLIPGSVNDWHAYLPKVGPMVQYIDLDLVCYATGDGNPSLAAFESEGGLGNDAQVNAEPWNDNQLFWAARFLRHLHDTEGTPLRAMESSLRSERGFGTHRLGIDPWRVAGGERWSSSRGKLCPGDAKHAQRYEVVRLAAALDGKSKSEEDEMSQYADQLNRIEARLLGDAEHRGYDMLQSIESMTVDIQNRVRGGHPAMDSLQVIQWQVAQVTAAQATQRPDVDEKALAEQITAALIPAVVAAVGKQGGLTAEQIAEATEKAVREIFADAGS